uniref:Uncharacterized protein n=1 Tax=uncultured prokaryote TaxID=198431 RepID=A0A0H5Q8V1_9ZZZZ|nr:hypothetical protein [uncultured prokaryote]
MVREILVDWTGPGAGDKVSVFHFIEATPVADQRSALAAFLNACDAELTTTTTWTIRQEGRELDTATGALVGAWTDSTPHTGSGGNGTAVVADATQVLIRWNTGNIVGGRFLKGRTFLPGLATIEVNGGNLNPAARTTFLNAAAAFIAAAVQVAVWHRPQSGSGGAVWAVETADVWSELAVLRRRRG